MRSVILNEIKKSFLTIEQMLDYYYYYYHLVMTIRKLIIRKKLNLNAKYPGISPQTNIT